MNQILKPDRRAFLVGASALGGLTLGIRIPEAEAAAASRPEVNAWVVVKPDESVVIRIARAEIGQGLQTGLAQLVAEELGCDWTKVSTEYPTAGENVARKRVWGAMNASGSQGIRASQDYVRKGGAAARIMLVQAAANGWNVPASECAVDKGVILHAASGRQTTYGAVAGAAAKLDPPKDITLKDPKDWTIAGKPLARLDTHDKVNGALVYGIDITLPGMLHAAIRACPVQGGTVKSFDAATAKTMRGVKEVMQVGTDAVAVVADSFWNAKQAVAAVTVAWETGESATVSSATIAEMMRAGLDADQAYVGNKTGDAKAALAAPGVKLVEASYNYPYQYHATMEPMNATALVTADRCEVWCPTQNAEAALAVATEASGLPIGKCEIYQTAVAGGGFGRRGRADYVGQAVRIAKAMPGTPVKLIWTREEDVTHCTYHPATYCKMTGALDAGGNLVGLHMRISGQSILASLAPERMEKGMDPFVFQGLTPAAAEGAFAYDVPNVLIDHAMRNTHLLAGFWRGVNANHNSIYVESFIDELAHAAGQDPLAFRRKMAKPKVLAVLNAVAERANYGHTADGVYQGLCAFHTFGSYVAACADVSVTKEGQLKILRIVAATDPGHIVNPASVERQVAGSFAMGLSSLLYGECTVKAGAIEQTNFDTYNIIRLDEFPKVEAILMPSGGFWGGVGEPTIAAAAPAVLNAIFAATGKRVRSVPLMNQNLAV